MCEKVQPLKIKKCWPCACLADPSKCFYICQAIDELRIALFKLLYATFLMQFTQFNCHCAICFMQFFSVLS